MVEVKKDDSNIIEVNPLVPTNGNDENTIAEVEVNVVPQLANYEPQLPYSGNSGNNIGNWLWLLGGAAFALLIYALASD